MMTSLGSYRQPVLLGAKKKHTPANIFINIKNRNLLLR